MSLYWPHSPQITVAPTGEKVRLIPAFTNHVSDSLAAALPPTLPVLKLTFLYWVPVFLVVLVQAVDEQARRNVHRRRADLEQLTFLAIVLERRAAATNHRNVAAGRAAILDARGEQPSSVSCV